MENTIKIKSTGHPNQCWDPGLNDKFVNLTLTMMPNKKLSSFTLRRITLQETNIYHIPF